MSSDQPALPGFGHEDGQPTPSGGDPPEASPITSTPTLDELFDSLARQPFRAKFRLRGRERAIAEQRGLATIRWHARDLIARRLAPAEPYKDGKQTPYRGHPVFVAQHATATCCRNCLSRRHGISKGRALDRSELDYVVEVLCGWIKRELGS